MKVPCSMLGNKVNWDISEFLLESYTFECKAEELGSCIEPEIISSSKILSCRKCKKLFSRKRTLERHKRNDKCIAFS